MMNSRSLLVLLVFAAPAVAGEPATLSLPDLAAAARRHDAAGDFAKAAPLWKQLTERNPVDGANFLQLANSLVLMKDYRAAAPAFAKAFELRAGYPSKSAYNVACCHALLGEKEEALRWLETALKSGFRSLSQAQTDADLKSLRDDPKYRELVMLAEVSKMSRDEGWRHDLKVADREIRRLHFNPYREFSREQWDAYVKKLHDDIPKMTDNQVAVAFIRLGRMAGDGHTHVRPPRPLSILPLQLFQFEDGYFITAAAPAYGDLAGAQVLKVGGHKIEDAASAVEAICSRDNLMGVKSLKAQLLTIPPTLNGLGLIPDADKITLSVRDASGKERDVTVKAESVSIAPGGTRAVTDWVTARKGAAAPEPLYLKNRRTAYWFEHLPEQKLVYCQYNAVRNDGKETFEQFCNRLFKFIDDQPVERLVIDLRWNGGGNSFLNKSLIHGLIRCTKINQPGKLFVIIGRNTFSAAQNCTTDIEMHSKAIFAGEPTGASPNFIGESIPFSLPYSKMTGTISDLYWVRSWPMDYRPWIAPQLYAPPTFSLFKENRDPALEAILAYPNSEK